MGCENWYLRFIILVPLVMADLCPEPIIPNGVVTGEKEQHLFFGEVTCNIGYHLVGASKTIKCRHGVWSHEELPVCSAIGACPYLPELQNGRNIPIQGSRSSAYRFKCNRSFKRFGELRTHCIGDRWSHTHMPSCAKATCDETGMLDIPYGEGRAMMGGAVYKYRCNHGVEMDGSNTLVCDGEKWNGTVPDCNVGPNEPELEVMVSGIAVTTVKPGDWVLVTCQAKGGHPIPDIGLTLDGLPSGSKDFRSFRNSFTFTASEKDDGKRIMCTAVNKVGTSVASIILHVDTPPTNAAISGPKTIHHDDEFNYECSVEGGNPAPEITWTLKDHLGQTKKVNGEMIAPGLSRMVLKTGSKLRIMTIICLGENNQGIVSHTMHVNTHYLPKTVEISGPIISAPGEYAHFTCLTTESFPVPTLKWRIEKTGDLYEVIDSDGDVSTEALGDGGVMAFAKIDIHIEKGNTNVLVKCSAAIEGLGARSSDQHAIDVRSIEEPVETFENKDKELSSSEAQNPDYFVEIGDASENNPNLNSVNSAEESGETYEASAEETQYSDYYIGTDDASENDQKSKDLIKIVNLEKIPDMKEQDRSRVLWIPIKPVEDIEDYQNIFGSHNKAVMEESDLDEDFLRPSEIPEATMLKQGKEAKETAVNSPVSVSMVYSSSSTISIQSLLLATALSLSMLFL